jgi:hypothetical protein
MMSLPTASSVNPVPDTRKRLVELSKCSPIAWRWWKSEFLLCQRINKWDDTLARAHLQGSLYGDAYEFVAHIDVDDFVAYPTIQDVLAAYEQCFIPQDLQAQSSIEFRNCQQREGEEPASFYCRLLRAYLNTYDHATDFDSQLLPIHAFIAGLRDSIIREELGRHTPQTVTDCLHVAMHYYEPDFVYPNTLVTPAPTTPSRIPLRQAHTASIRRCYLCGDKGHVTFHCPVQIQQRKDNKSNRAPKKKEGPGDSK